MRKLSVNLHAAWIVAVLGFSGYQFGLIVFGAIHHTARAIREKKARRA